MLVALTVDEAIECIQTRRGYRVDPESGCWIWDGAEGFGPYLAFYEAAFGRLPDDCRPYHLCSNGRRGCVRPGHLDVALPGEPLPEPTPSLVERSGIAHRLTDERVARRWTHGEMGRFLGLAATTVEAYEQGRVPTEDQYRLLSAKLGWSRSAKQWAVVMLAERVVTAVSAGDAAREVWDAIELEGQPGKTEVVQVRPTDPT